MVLLFQKLSLQISTVFDYPLPLPILNTQIEKQASRLQHAEEIFKSLLGLPEVTITRPRETETGFQADFLVNHLISVVSSAKKKNR